MSHSDQKAFEALYDATVQRVYNVALRVLGDTETAEEIVSDVYFQVWEQAARYDPARASVQTWLLMICRSRALDALRRRGPRLAGEEMIDSAAASTAAPGAMDIVEAMERGVAVRQCLESLSPVQRQVLSLAFFKGLTHGEIALSQGMPLGTVKSHIRGALRRMRELLGEDRAEHG